MKIWKRYRTKGCFEAPAMIATTPLMMTNGEGNGHKRKTFIDSKRFP